MKHPKAFTLIELLVVISIIALLIGILLPVLKNARDAARDVACQAMIRQNVVMFSIYHDDFDGWSPAVYDGSAPNPVTGGAGMYWNETIARHTNNDGREASYCPSFSPDEYTPGLSYAMTSADHTATTNGYIRASALLKTDNVLLLADSMFKPVSGEPIQSFRMTYYNNTPDNRRMHMRHSGAANTLFYDLHVSRSEDNDLPDLMAPVYTSSFSHKAILQPGPWSYFDENEVARDY